MCSDGAQIRDLTLWRLGIDRPGGRSENAVTTINAHTPHGHTACSELASLATAVARSLRSRFAPCSLRLRASPACVARLPCLLLASLACSQPPLASSPAARYAARRLSCSLQLSLHRSPPLMLARSARRLTCSSRFVRRLLLAPLAASSAARFARRWPLRLLLASLADSPTGYARLLQHFLAGVVE
eukprot:6427672-Prymnesium_polylepis.1